MSVEREDGLIRFCCDGKCHANYESDEDFQGAWQEAKHLGWVNAEVGGRWEHFCPTCKRELGE